MNGQIVYDITSLAGKIGSSLEDLERRLQVLEREIGEVHNFLTEIGIPNCDENGYQEYPNTPIGRRLKILRKRKIEFENI
jgi:hypothetical protein